MHRSAADQAFIAELLGELGVTPARFQELRTLPLFNARQRLAELKEDAKRNFRRRAFELHPDRNNDDEAKTARLKALAQVNDWVQSIEVREPPPVPVRVAFSVSFTHHNPFASTSTSTTGW